MAVNSSANSILGYEPVVASTDQGLWSLTGYLSCQPFKPTQS